MSITPIGHAESLRIGTVDFVSPAEIKVVLDIEAPDSVALNAGGPRPFPRVNGYVLIPVDDAFLVGQVGWLTVERSAFPKRRGMQDFGLIDLPYPLRKMSLAPLGTLKKFQSSLRGVEGYGFQRGTESFPTIGSSVLLPTDAQLRSIVESGERRRVKIGTSPLAGNAEVCVDPNRLFGRHLAVLGNTGSGKSCSVAGLIRWSIEEAQKKKHGVPNARFIVLDPNGEYSRAFSSDIGCLKARVFKVAPDPDVGEMLLQVPLWFWNSAEWCAFAQASPGVQRPLLKRALRDVKSGRTGVTPNSEQEQLLHLRRYLSSCLITVEADIHNSAIKTEATKVGKKLKAYQNDLIAKEASFPGRTLAEIARVIGNVLEETYGSFTKNGETISYYQAFTESGVQQIVEAIQQELSTLGGIMVVDGPDEDVPARFQGIHFVDHLDMLSHQEGVAQYLDFLINRIRTFLSDSRMKTVIEDDGSVTLEGWLESIAGSKDTCIAILDLSLVPSEIIHVVSAVVGRVLFEALQRYRKLKHASLPTVLVVEEAHTFARRYKEDSENHNTALVCCQVFERIAREGRKFGLGMVVSSQRPSELSPTIISQCNSFLLHRISNDRDQEIVNRLVPDNLRGLLRELPTLPSQYAFLLGWASELPILVKLKDLPRSQRPQSDDPDFWEVWTGTNDMGEEVKRESVWKAVADDWLAHTTRRPFKASEADDTPEFDPNDVGDDREPEFDPDEYQEPPEESIPWDIPESNEQPPDDNF